MFFQSRAYQVLIDVFDNKGETKDAHELCERTLRRETTPFHVRRPFFGKSETEGCLSMKKEKERSYPGSLYIRRVRPVRNTHRSMQVRF